MRNILTIIFIMVAMGYMVSILFDKYTVAVEEQNKKILEQK